MAQKKSKLYIYQNGLPKKFKVHELRKSVLGDLHDPRLVFEARFVGVAFFCLKARKTPVESLFAGPSSTAHEVPLSSSSGMAHGKLMASNTNKDPPIW